MHFPYSRQDNRLSFLKFHSLTRTLWYLHFKQSFLNRCFDKASVMFDTLTVIAFIFRFFLIIIQIILFISLKLILLYLKKSFGLN